MSLAYIKRKYLADSGVTSPQLNAEQLAHHLDIINQAAQEVYYEKDLPISLAEVYVRANSNKELALPPFIGELRAIRSTLYNDKWELQDLRPRYHALDWPNQWKKWRIKGYSPTRTEITNAAPGDVVYPVIDADLTITIVGETTNSNRAVDKVVMDAATKSWTKSFTDIKSITKSKITDYNIIIKNAAGTEIALIYADQLEARYVIVDVSLYPNLQLCPDGTYIMEILYKPALPRLENDDDSFPVDGFDDIVAAKAVQLSMELQPDKEERALLADRKISRQISRRTEDKVGTTQKKVKFSRNPMLGIFRRTSNIHWDYARFNP